MFEVILKFEFFDSERSIGILYLLILKILRIARKCLEYLKIAAFGLKSPLPFYSYTKNGAFVNSIRAHETSEPMFPSSALIVLLFKEYEIKASLSHQLCEISIYKLALLPKALLVYNIV